MNQRVLFCPRCSGRYEVALEIALDPHLLLLCGVCGQASRPDTATTDDTPALDVASQALLDASRPLVVVGHETPAAARSVAQVLRAGGFAPICVRSGELVLAACHPSMPARPAAVILDVGITDVLAFELIERLRGEPETAHIVVVLLASVFDRTRYKRRPTKLYGADGFVELHHASERLAPLLRELAADSAPTNGVASASQRARGEDLRACSASDPSAVLARRLISDLVLHHHDEVGQGVKRGDPFGALTQATDAARDVFVRASTGSSAFDEELARFRDHLLERDGRGRSVHDG